MEKEIAIPKEATEFAMCKCGSLDWRPSFNLVCYKGFLSNNVGIVQSKQRWKCMACGEILEVDESGYPSNRILATKLKQIP